jgi:hypothetical protein
VGALCQGNTADQKEPVPDPFVKSILGAFTKLLPSAMAIPSRRRKRSENYASGERITQNVGLIC